MNLRAVVNWILNESILHRKLLAMWLNTMNLKIVTTTKMMNVKMVRKINLRKFLHLIFLRRYIKKEDQWSSIVAEASKKNAEEKRYSTDCWSWVQMFILHNFDWFISAEGPCFGCVQHEREINQLKKRIDRLEKLAPIIKKFRSNAIVNVYISHSGNISWQLMKFFRLQSWILLHLIHKLMLLSNQMSSNESR